MKVIATMDNNWLDLTDGQPVEFYRVSDEAVDELFDKDDVETVVCGETPLVSVRVDGGQLEIQLSKAVSEISPPTRRLGPPVFLSTSHGGPTSEQRRPSGVQVLWVWRSASPAQP